MVALGLFFTIIVVTSCIADAEAWGFLDSDDDIPTAKYTSASGFLHSKSPLHLMKLAKFDRVLYDKLGIYKEVLNRRLKLIQSYIDDFEKYSLDVPGVGLDDEEHWYWATLTSSQPIRALRLIRRMTSRLPKVLGHIEIGAETEFMTNIYEAKEGLDWPSENDTEVILESLLDIPLVFDNIPVGHISDGSLTGVKLEATECNELSVAAYERMRHASAVQWIEAAWKRFEDEDPKTIPSGYLEKNLREAIEDHDHHLSKLIETKGEAELSQFWNQDLFVENIETLPTFEGNSLRHLHERSTEEDKLNPTVRFRRICSGGNYQTSIERHGGKCLYLRSFHPYLRLNPLKFEVLHRIPLVVQIHDFISQSMSIALILEGMNQLEKLNGIQDSLAAEEKLKSLPVPAILQSDQLDSLAPFESKIKLLVKTSGRETEHETSERLHVGVYSFANYDRSLDQFPDPVLPAGDEPEEQETFNVHLFLNTVEMGGQTVFPQLGFGVKPIQNSALVWAEYKNHLAGPVHEVWANCPIISGNKWVATKYFRRFGTELDRLNTFQ